MRALHRRLITCCRLQFPLKWACHAIAAIGGQPYQASSNMAGEWTKDERFASNIPLQENVADGIRNQAPPARDLWEKRTVSAGLHPDRFCSISLVVPSVHFSKCSSLLDSFSAPLPGFNARTLSRVKGSLCFNEVLCRALARTQCDNSAVDEKSVWSQDARAISLALARWTVMSQPPFHSHRAYDTSI